MDQFSQTTSVQLSPNLPPNALQANDKEHQIALFVGAKYAKYYKEKFDQITPKKQMAGFNIAAFFLGIIWLFYRKMYLYGFIGIALIFILGVIEEMLDLSGTSGSIGLSVVFGLFGNTLYKNFVEKKITQLHSDEEMIKAGGTSIWAALGIFMTAILLVWVFI